MSDSFQYEPEDDEISDALQFMMNCSDKDLKESWIRLSSEWDMESIVRLHKGLCSTNRIEDLLLTFSES